MGPLGFLGCPDSEICQGLLAVGTGKSTGEVLSTLQASGFLVLLRISGYLRCRGFLFSSEALSAWVRGACLWQHFWGSGHGELGNVGLGFRVQGSGWVSRFWDPETPHMKELTGFRDAVSSKMNRILNYTRLPTLFNKALRLSTRTETTPRIPQIQPLRNTLAAPNTNGAGRFLPTDWF